MRSYARLPGRISNGGSIRRVEQGANHLERASLITPTSHHVVGKSPSVCSSFCSIFLLPDRKMSGNPPVETLHFPSTRRERQRPPILSRIPMKSPPLSPSLGKPLALANHCSIWLRSVKSIDRFLL